jgi:hypothetical protein
MIAHCGKSVAIYLESLLGDSWFVMRVAVRVIACGLYSFAKTKLLDVSYVLLISYRR